MKIKIKYIVKWFIMLFPLILFMIFYIKNGESYFIQENIENNLFYSYLYSISEVSMVFSSLSKLLCIFFHPDFTHAFDMFEHSFYFGAIINSCFTWFIMIWIMWELGEIIAKFWHKLMRMEEE